MKTLSLAIAAAGLMAAACAPTEAVETPVPSGDGPSQCKADQYQRFVGQNRSTLPSTPSGETWRVTCTTCPVTMDFNPNRLNIVYDDATGVIREVKCG